MASCVISRLDDVPEPVCMVHVRNTPCELNGEIADSEPLHSMNPQAGRHANVMAWWHRTKGQRPLILHRRTPSDVEIREHSDNDEGGCWCVPEVIPASPEPIPRPKQSA